MPIPIINVATPRKTIDSVITDLYGERVLYLINLISKNIKPVADRAKTSNAGAIKK